MPLVTIDERKNEVILEEREEQEVEAKPRRMDARSLNRRGVEDDKIRSATIVAADSVTTAMLQNLAVTQAKIAADAVGQSELKSEQAQIVISGTSTSGTATVTSGAIPIGYFLSAFTTPTASYVQLAVSGTTLTATLSTAPGAGNSVTIEVILLKS